MRVRSGGTVREREADRVVLALPFSVLRRLDCAGAGFSEVKRLAIERLGNGAHRKLHLQFRSRPWSRPGAWGISSGSSVSDLPYEVSWESTRGQQGAAGILVVFTTADASSPASSPDQAAHEVLPFLEQIWPGTAAEWNGRASVNLPGADPHRLGSYSCWLRGQCTLFAGAEGERSGKCHFAGEHTSLEHQGYMEGAAAEGVRAAREILDDYAAGRFP